MLSRDYVCDGQVVKLSLEKRGEERKYFSSFLSPLVTEEERKQEERKGKKGNDGQWNTDLSVSVVLV